jgi:succinate-semialdehyde dehydrogenase / glutarate-semialdehyde dehydrogenase
VSREVGLAASILQYYGDRGPEFLAPTPLPVDVGEAQIMNEPLGVLLGIEPWNFPLYQVVRFAGPNLVVGNTILLKHAEICPQSALALERLFTDAGAPPGVYTNVFLRIPDVAQVIGHPAVQGASLTGSEQAGMSVGEIAGRNLKKCVLELGGSDPFIVLDAADLDHAVTTATAGRLANTGQRGVGSKRLIVMASRYDEFVSRLADTFSSLRRGDPADPATTLGPLSSERAAAGLAEQVRDALDKGATAVTGGGRPDHPGALVDATVLTGVRPGCAPTPRSCSARSRPSTASPTMTRRSSWRTPRASGSAGPCGAATRSGRARSLTGWTAAWSGSTSRRPRRLTCRSAG